MVELPFQSRVGAKYEIRCSEKFRLGSFGWTWFATDVVTNRPTFLKVLEPFERGPDSFDPSQLDEDHFVPFMVRGEQINGANRHIITHSRFFIGLPVEPEVSHASIPEQLKIYKFDSVVEAIREKTPDDWWDLFPGIASLAQRAVSESRAVREVAIDPFSLFVVQIKEAKSGAVEERLLLLDAGVHYDPVKFEQEGGAQNAFADGLAYVAPEVLASLAAGKEREDTDPMREAVYSLGALLYRLLFGVAPIEAGTVEGVLESASKRRKLRFPSGTNQRLVAAINRAVDLNPSARQETIEAFVAELREIPRWNQLDPPPAWHKWAKIGAAAIVVIAMVLGWLEYDRPERRFGRTDFVVLRQAQVEGAPSKIDERMRQQWGADLSGYHTYLGLLAALRLDSLDLTDQARVGDVLRSIDAALASCQSAGAAMAVAELLVWKHYLRATYGASAEADQSERLAQLARDLSQDLDRFEFDKIEGGQRGRGYKLLSGLGRLFTDEPFTSLDAFDAYRSELGGAAVSELWGDADRTWLRDHILGWHARAIRVSEGAQPDPEATKIATELLLSAATSRGARFPFFKDTPADAPQNPIAWEDLLECRQSGSAERVFEQLRPMVIGATDSGTGNVRDALADHDNQRLRAAWARSLGPVYEKLVVAFVESELELAKVETRRFVDSFELLRSLVDGKFFPADVEIAEPGRFMKYFGEAALGEMSGLMGRTEPDRALVRHAHGRLKEALNRPGAFEKGVVGQRAAHRIALRAVIEVLGDPGKMSAQVGQEAVVEYAKEGLEHWKAANGEDEAPPLIAVGAELPADWATGSSKADTARRREELRILFERSARSREIPAATKLELLWTAYAIWRDRNAGGPVPATFDTRGDLAGLLLAEATGSREQAHLEILERHFEVSQDALIRLAQARLKSAEEASQTEEVKRDLAEAERLLEKVSRERESEKRLLGARVAFCRAQRRTGDERVTMMLRGIEHLSAVVLLDVEQSNEARELRAQKADELARSLDGEATPPLAPLKVASSERTDYAELVDIRLRELEPKTILARFYVQQKLRLLAAKSNPADAISLGLNTVGDSVDVIKRWTPTHRDAFVCLQPNEPDPSSDRMLRGLAFLIARDARSDQIARLEAATRLDPGNAEYLASWAREKLRPVLTEHPYVHPVPANKFTLEQRSLIVQVDERFRNFEVEPSLPQEVQVEILWHQGVAALLRYLTDRPFKRQHAQRAAGPLLRLVSATAGGVKEELAQKLIGQRLKDLDLRAKAGASRPPTAADLLELCANLYADRSARFGGGSGQNSRDALKKKVRELLAGPLKHIPYTRQLVKEVE